MGKDLGRIVISKGLLITPHYRQGRVCLQNPIRIIIEHDGQVPHLCKRTPSNISLELPMQYRGHIFYLTKKQKKKNAVMKIFDFEYNIDFHYFSHKKIKELKYILYFYYN